MKSIERSQTEGHRPSLDCAQPAAAFGRRQPAAEAARWLGEHSGPGKPRPQQAAGPKAAAGCTQSKAAAAALLGFALLLFAPILSAQNTIQQGNQDLLLKNGWNAVWLRVEPRNAEGDLIGPAAVFSDSKIKIVASPKPLAGLAEFISSNPGDGGTLSIFNQQGWQQWRRVDNAGANNLPLVIGNRPYLVKVEGAGAQGFSHRVTGVGKFFRPTWTPDRYNLLGFGINGSMTFKQFFEPVAATHPVGKIYTLGTDGNWTTVDEDAAIGDGVAYWIFSNGTSEYMGPVAVDFPLAKLGVLNFGGPGDAVPVTAGPNTLELDLEEVIFTSRWNADSIPSLELITPDPKQGASALTLHQVTPTPNTLDYQTGQALDFSGGRVTLSETVNPTSTSILTLGARRDWITRPTDRTNLYQLTTGNPGTVHWLPILAARTDLAPTDDRTPLDEKSLVAGLWVGAVAITSVTSVVEDGEPTRPAAGNAPIRILLHSDGEGKVSLLNQVTIMQTKTADPAVAPVPVLVVDPRRLPFYEGIKERKGKRVGVRVQAVAYDMPRDTRVTVQERDPDNSNEAEAKDLIDFIVAESTSPVTRWLNGKGRYDERSKVDQAAIEDYILFRPLRPPPLKEVYQMSLLLDGALGAGKTVKTRSGTLTLDPFHRTNPFRHAFSQRHPRGPTITRELTIVFEGEQAIADRLRGTFTETISGLTKSGLTLSGRIQLHRVSGVAALEGAEQVPAP